MSVRLARILTAAAVLWLAAVVSAPLALGTETLRVPAAHVYGAASRICHQRPERSFHMAGAQLPVCARCFGLYASGALGAMLAWGSRRRSVGSPRLMLAVAAAPTFVTWALEAAGLMPFSNSARAIAALPFGAAAGWVFVQLLRYDAGFDGHEIDDRRSRTRVG